MPPSGRTAVIDFDQIADVAGWLELRLSGALGVSPGVGLLFRCDYGVRRRCGVGDRLVQHPSDSKWDSVIARTVMVETQRHSRSVAKESSPVKSVAKEASSAKDVSPVVATAKADTKKSKHYKPKVVARQRNNYGYGNALGYAEESRYGPRGLFFR